MGHENFKVDLIALILFSIGLAGCAGQVTPLPDASNIPDEPLVNHVPPEMAFTTSSLSGYPPLDVSVEVTMSDSDGGLIAAQLLFQDEGMSASEVRLRPNETRTSVLAATLHSIGSHSFQLIVDDGDFRMIEEFKAEVLDPSPRPLLTHEANVEQTCRACTRYPPTDGDRLGATACQGMHTNQQGQDCTWVELTTDMGGMEFEADSTGVNVDLEFRTQCSSDPTTQIEQIHEYNGKETGTVPAGARCAVLWETDDAPSTLSFIVFAGGPTTT